MSNAPQSPPPPPPPPPEPPRETQGGSSTLAWVGSATLLAVVALPQFFLGDAEGGRTVAYGIGRVLGAAMFGIAIGYFIWWLIRRSIPGSSKWSPWVLVIASGIATLFLFSGLAETGAALNSGSESAQEAEAPYEGPASSYFLEPKGYQYRELPPEVREELEKQFSSGTKAAEEVSEFDGRHVVQAGQPVGATVVFLMDVPPDAWDESHQGFIDGFEETGGVTLEPRTIAGVEALFAELPRGVTYVLLDRNLVIQVIGFTEDSARDIAEAQVPALAN